MSGSSYPELHFNSKEFTLRYGSDGMLYAEHKVNKTFFIFLNGQWLDLDDALAMMQSVPDNYLEEDLDEQENFSDDY